MTPGHSPRSRRPRPRSMPGARNTMPTGRTRHWTWPPQPRGSAPRWIPPTRCRCGRLPIWSPSAARRAYVLTGGRRRARELARCGGARPGRPGLGEHERRAAAILARYCPRRAAGHLLDRHRLRPPEHRRVADQDRAVPAVRGGPGPVAPRWGPPGRSAARRTVTGRTGRQQVRGSRPAGHRHRRDHAGNQLILVGSPLAGSAPGSASMAS